MSSQSERIPAPSLYTRRNFLGLTATAAGLVFVSNPTRSLSVIEKALQNTARAISEVSLIPSFEKQSWELPGFVGLTEAEFEEQRKLFEFQTINSKEAFGREEGVLLAREFTLDSPKQIIFRVDANTVSGEDHRHTIEARIFKNDERLYPVNLIAPLVRSDDSSSVDMNLWTFGRGDYRIELLQDETSRDRLVPSDIKSVSVLSFNDDTLWGRVLAHSPIIAVDLENERDVDNDGILALYARILKDKTGKILVGYEFIASGQRSGTPPKKHRDKYGRDYDAEWGNAKLFGPNGELLYSWLQGHRHQKKEFNGESIFNHDLTGLTYGNSNLEDEHATDKWYVIASEIVVATTSPSDFLREYPSHERIATEELRREGKLLPDGTPR